MQRRRVYAGGKQKTLHGRYPRAHGARLHPLRYMQTAINRISLCLHKKWVIKMDNENELPKRKSTRLKNFDYSSAGAYFVTICIRDRMHILSEIVKTDLTITDKSNGLSVGEGLAPPDVEGLAPPDVVGEGLAPPEITVKLKPCGEIAKEQLQSIETRFPDVTIEDYVIMPDHIHAIIFLQSSR